MLTISSPSQLIASLPALLGFPPTESLVLVTLVEGCIGVVLRADLDGAADDVLANRMEAAAEFAARQGADAAVIVVVDREGYGDPVRAAVLDGLADNFGVILRKHDVSVLGAHVVDRVDEGGHWRCADNCGAGGLIGDPAATEIAALAVATGRRMYADRAELTGVVAVDPVRVAALAPLVEKLGPVVDYHLAEASARSVASRLVGGEVVDDDDLAAVGASLVDPQVRDRLYRLAVADTAVEVELLWTVLARVLPDRWRVEALVLLAVCAFVRGDGPLTSVVVGEALEVCPGHRMAGLLDVVVRGGVSPEEMAALLLSP